MPEQGGEGAREEGSPVGIWGKVPGRGNGSCKGCEVGLSVVVFEEHLEGASVVEPSEVKREGG